MRKCNKIIIIILLEEHKLQKLHLKHISDLLVSSHTLLCENKSKYCSSCYFPENAVMTVRRYSTSSNLSGVALREGRIDRGWHGNSGWGRLQEEIHHVNGVFGNSAKGEVGKATNRHSLQEYVHKNRYNPNRAT